MRPHTNALSSYRQFDKNLCTPLRPFRAAFGLELSAQQGYPLPHAGHPKGLTFGQRFRTVKAHPVVFYRELQPSIGRSQKNIYAGGAGMLADVVKAFLD